jgi:hypothetical protein
LDAGSFRLRGCSEVGGEREVTEVIWPVEDDESEREGFRWKSLLPRRLMTGAGWGLLAGALAWDAPARKGWRREFAEVERRGRKGLCEKEERPTCWFAGG